MALATLAAMPPQKGTDTHDGKPALESFDDITYDSMFKMTDEIRNKNYAHNMSQELPIGIVDQNGMIINQNAMSEFRINNYTVQYGGCGAIALYNTIKTLDPDTEVTFPQAISWMEPYGILNHTFGAAPTGITDCLNKMGYEAKFVPPTKSIEEAAKEADAAIVLYAATANIHYVAFHASGEDEAGNTRFTFYNESGDMNDIRTYSEFTEELTDQDRTEIAQIGIVVRKK